MDKETHLSNIGQSCWLKIEKQTLACTLWDGSLRHYADDVVHDGAYDKLPHVS